ncbi:zinc finger, CCHC-type containing protein [Tanacetum coccineum]
MVNSMLSYSGLSEGVVVRHPDPKRRTLGEKESRDAIFDENRFSSIPKPKNVILNLVESQRDDHFDYVPSEIPEPRKGKRVQKAKSYGFDFQLYLVEGSRDQVGSQYYYCYNIEEDLRTYNEDMFSMKDMREEDFILGIKIKRENKEILITQSHYIQKILKKFNHEDCSPVSTPMNPVEKLKPNTGKPVDQLEYSSAIGCLIGTMNYGLPYVGYPSVLEGYSDASWINHVEDSSFTSEWVFLLRGGPILWASKKQTCIIGSTVEFEFVALVAAGKEAEWLRNLIHEIPIWPKPIALISIQCDSVLTMAKAYSQAYN